ncbi:MAG TPA: hypothetical protein VJ803_09590, partial [Gemmatimonadaceae bacterium]|nr:hypothetical protein [Gemmatimonadaceae bacterium]
YYVRQLQRAARAEALTAREVVVVDHDASCSVARALRTSDGERADEPLPVILATADWHDYFDEYLAAAGEARDAAEDAIVPSPLMPHLMFDWLLRRARARWPERGVEKRPLGREPNIPWQRADAGGTHYVSFAEWVCPINCIEPAICPEIRGPRTWSMPPAVRAYVNAERARGRRLVGPALFHCTHRAYGVGMFDTADVLAADALVTSQAARGDVEVLVGTVSHCHGALDVLRVGP